MPQKRQVLRVKDTSRSLCYPVLCGDCLPSCQAERQAPGLLDEILKIEMLMIIVFVFVNMGPNATENFKTLLIQITAKSFQTCPEFSCVGIFEVLSF